MWNLDLALADVVATSTDPALGAIRLAWRRERLEELDSGAAPAEPRLRAIARQLVERGISGKDLAKLEDGWLPLLAGIPWGEAQAAGLKERGRLLFGIGAKLLGGRAADGEVAGALWSMADGAAHVSDPGSRDMLLAEARKALAELPTRSSPIVRPLTVLAALAANDLLRGEGGARRVAAALAHQLRGTFPRGG